MEQITGQLTSLLNNMGMQFLSFAVVIVIAYVLVSIILRLIKVPVAFAKLLSVLATIGVMYYAYKEIFLS
ncbi:hypothetical protein ABE042_07370 [Viridibacillus arvi]|uniref:hypothetical protein n=1 Tax=Viridibacillus arvi TaxID=263475 RepID=UPI003D278358